MSHVRRAKAGTLIHLACRSHPDTVGGNQKLVEALQRNYINSDASQPLVDRLLQTRSRSEVRSSRRTWARSSSLRLIVSRRPTNVLATRTTRSSSKPPHSIVLLCYLQSSQGRRHLNSELFQRRLFSRRGIPRTSSKRKRRNLRSVFHLISGAVNWN